MKFEDQTDPKPPDVLVGGIVGSTIGTIIGPICNWLLGDDQFVLAGTMGAGIGTIAGLGFGVVHRQRRRDVTNTNLGVSICTAFPLVISTLLLTTMGGARGKIGGYVLTALVFAGPMAGMIVGSAIDRFYEAFLVRRAGAGNE